MKKIKWMQPISSSTLVGSFCLYASFMFILFFILFGTPKYEIFLSIFALLTGVLVFRRSKSGFCLLACSILMFLGQSLFDWRDKGVWDWCRFAFGVILSVYALREIQSEVRKGRWV